MEELSQALLILPGNKTYIDPVDRTSLPVSIRDTFNIRKFSETKEWFLFVLQFNKWAYVKKKKKKDNLGLVKFMNLGCY